ncbi:MAG: 4'-phosphopantetheinyl transferase superfamily protein [Sphingobacteriaceae bacterium]|nr:4'-phosphopantetheinyl transferase superfamily protein [Sphingobacteriaceae bacterium]
MIHLEYINDELSLGMLDLQGFKAVNVLNEKREIERKGTLFLLKKMLNTESVELVYNELNRPFLKGRSEHISISHSHQWLAISIHITNETGVDVELIREKVINIKHKFCCDAELEFAQNDIDKLTFLWCCKEAVYKVYGKRELEFKNIIVDSLDLKPRGEVNACIHFEDHIRNYKLMYRKFDGYFLALIAHEIR